MRSLRRHPASSGVIRRHQASSGVISGNPWSSPWRDVAISWKSARRSPESTPDPACGGMSGRAVLSTGMQAGGGLRSRLRTRPVGMSRRAVLSTCMQADSMPDRNGLSRSQSQSRSQIVTASRGRAAGASRRQSESESESESQSESQSQSQSQFQSPYLPLEAEQLAQQLDQRVLGQVADLMRDAIICNQRPLAHLISRVIRRHQASSGVIRRHQASSGVIRRHQASSAIIRRHQASSGVISAPGIEAARSRRSW